MFSPIWLEIISEFLTGISSGFFLLTFAESSPDFNLSVENKFWLLTLRLTIVILALSLAKIFKQSSKIYEQS